MLPTFTLNFLLVRNLSKNTTYVVVIHQASDNHNTYGCVVNAYKITNAKRTYLDVSNEQTDLYTDSNQMAKKYLERMGFNVPTYLSEAPNVVVSSHKVKYSQLK